MFGSHAHTRKKNKTRGILRPQTRALQQGPGGCLTTASTSHHRGRRGFGPSPFPSHAKLLCSSLLIHPLGGGVATKTRYPLFQPPPPLLILPWVPGGRTSHIAQAFESVSDGRMSVRAAVPLPQDAMRGRGRYGIGLFKSWTLVRLRGLGGLGHKCVYQQWPNQIFPTVEFIFSRDGPFGLGGVGGLLLWSSALLIHPCPSSEGVEPKMGVWGGSNAVRPF